MHFVTARQLALGLGQRVGVGSHEVTMHGGLVAQTALPSLVDALEFERTLERERGFGLGARARAVAPLLQPRLLPCGTLAMAPAQELINALTMLIPLATALGAAALPMGTGAHIIAAAIVLHFPFSFAYHISCALKPGSHPVVDNRYWKGDAVAIHLAGASMALGTSGSLAWLVLNLVFNLICSYRTLVWCNSQRERRLCRWFCAIGYIAPIGLVDPALASQAFWCFFATALPFVLNARLGGWGHALSHVVLGRFAVSIIAAGAATEAPFSEAPAMLVRGVSDALGGSWVLQLAELPVSALALMIDVVASTS